MPNDVSDYQMMVIACNCRIVPVYNVSILSALSKSIPSWACNGDAAQRFQHSSSQCQLHQPGMV